MVRKEHIVKVQIEWPENKPARLAKKGKNVCPRGCKDPRNCEICPWFAGYWDTSSRNIDFMQRWLGVAQRRVAFVQCGAPPEIKANVSVPDDKGVVVGLSPDAPGYEDAHRKKVASEKPKAEPESEPTVEPEPAPEPEESVL